MSLTSPLRTPPWIAAPTATTSTGLTPRRRLLADQLLDLRLRHRHAGHPADEHDVVDLRVEPGVRQGLLGRADRPLEQVVRQLLELGARQLQVEVLGALGRGGDEREVDLRRHRRGELDLRLLAGLVQARWERHRVGGEVDALVRCLNSATIQSTIALSKLSPPRWLSPFVDLDLEDAASCCRRRRAPTRRTCRRRGRRRGSSVRAPPCRARRRAPPRSVLLMMRTTFRPAISRRPSSPPRAGRC